MREFQAVVRVEHEDLNLSDAEAREMLDGITGELEAYSATAQLWENRSEFTLTVRVPSLWDVAATAGRAVREAFHREGRDVSVVRVDAWTVEEWDLETSV
jgi:hypothetical protein